MRVAWVGRFWGWYIGAGKEGGRRWFGRRGEGLHGEKMGGNCGELG